MDEMLSVKDLEVSYGAIRAVKGISFHVNKGRDCHTDRRERGGKNHHAARHFRLAEAEGGRDYLLRQPHHTYRGP